MNKKELEYVRNILEHIKEPDEKVKLALAYVNKDIQRIKAMRGQLKDQYEADLHW